MVDTKPLRQEPLTPAAFYILLVLSSGDAHGYRIMLEVEEFSDGLIVLGAGTLYRSLHRMVPDGLVTEVPDASGASAADERRRLYRITALGRTAARAEARRLHLLVTAARARGLLGEAKPTRPARMKEKR